MEECIEHQLLGAYHDRELGDEQREAVEAHLSGCKQCQAELADLSALSSWLVTAATPPLSPIGLHRLHARVDSVMEEGLVRFVRLLSGVAACLLVGASIGLMRVKIARPAEVAPPWMDLAVVANLENSASSEAVSSDANTPAATYYLADLNNRVDSRSASELP